MTEAFFTSRSQTVTCSLCSLCWPTLTQSGQYWVHSCDAWEVSSSLLSAHYFCCSVFRPSLTAIEGRSAFVCANMCAVASSVANAHARDDPPKTPVEQTQREPTQSDEERFASCGGFISRWPLLGLLAVAVIVVLVSVRFKCQG
eukprot:m.381747 g.381747  ORF g.381747 m.381747 type:complete len:144 (+) comp56242_c0_seq67:590-1021(+)